VQSIPRSISVAFVATAAIAASALSVACSANAPRENVNATTTASQALDLASYSASDAVAYASAHWDDGVGLCSEFTTDCLRAGHVDIAVIPYVPNLYAALTSAGISYEEHTAGASDVSANAGDVIIFSDATGSGFCDAAATEESNCGHVCLITVGGSSEDSILADCHNNAHHHIAIGYEVSGGYTSYRIYHLDGGSSGGGSSSAPPGTEGCSSDADCNDGESGTGVVCATSEGYCIKGCHSDDDCPSGTSCTDTQPHYSCQ
jgi:hypothetical protein